jgi:hypothetical protein
MRLPFTSWGIAKARSLLSCTSEKSQPATTLAVSLLEHREDEWLDWHQGHMELDEEYEEESTVRSGELQVFDPERDEEGPKHPSERPWGKNATVEMKADSHSKQEFISIHDYLWTLYPWLLNLKKDNLGAISVFEDDPPLPETELKIAFATPDMLVVQRKAEWLQTWQSPPSTFIEHFGQSQLRIHCWSHTNNPISEATLPVITLIPYIAATIVLGLTWSQPVSGPWL